MKKIFAVIVAAVMVMPEVLAIQSGESTQGSEFYFSFMRARRDREKTMTLFVSSETDGQLELTNPQKGLDRIEGYLEDSDGQLLTVSYMDKTFKRKVQIIKITMMQIHILILKIQILILNPNRQKKKKLMMMMMI